MTEQEAIFAFYRLLACAPINGNGVSGDYVIGIDGPTGKVIRVPVSDLGVGQGGGSGVSTYDLVLNGVTTATVTQSQHGLLRILDAYILNEYGQKPSLEINISLPSQSASFYSNTPITGKFVIFGTNEPIS